MEGRVSCGDPCTDQLPARGRLPNLETRWTDSQADGNPSNQLQEAGEEEKGLLQFTLLKDSSMMKLHDSQMALPR